jgi:hypothetical protein
VGVEVSNADGQEAADTRSSQFLQSVWKDLVTYGHSSLLCGNSKEIRWLFTSNSEIQILLLLLSITLLQRN